MVVRSSPVDYKFSAVDHSRLRRQARQKLGVSIDAVCWSSLEVHFHSAEDRVATITAHSSARVAIDRIVLVPDVR